MMSPKPINPSVSFIELNKTDPGGAPMDADNTNVGGLSHPGKPSKKVTI